MEKDKKYFCVTGKLLANGLNFCGFSYYKYNDEETNEINYSFEDTENFREALTTLINLRKKNNKYKK
jgi:hypothetical protein